MSRDDPQVERRNRVRRALIRSQTLGSVTLGLTAIVMATLSDGTARWLLIVGGLFLLASPILMTRLRRREEEKAQQVNPQHEAGY